MPAAGAFGRSQQCRRLTGVDEGYNGTRDQSGRHFEW